MIKDIYDLEFNVTPGNDGNYLMNATVNIDKDKLRFIGEIVFTKLDKMPGIYGSLEEPK